MIPLSIPHLQGNEWKYIKDCLDTNWVSAVGSYVDRFEREFAGYIGVENACVTINGTAALELSLRILGIGPGDEVIVPSLTFAASVNAVRYVGADPVFADVCRDTYVMDAEMIGPLISDNTRAIMPVHIYGHPADMDSIMETARKHGLFVIEDATESLGSTYKGKQTGSFGHMGCFSFNGNKMITTGAGGMIASANPEYIARARFLSNQAKPSCDIPEAVYHDEIGYNYRMSNISAALGCAQLENLGRHVAAKISNAEKYDGLLRGKPGITLPVQKEHCVNCHWLYSVVIEDDYRMKRNELISHLKDNGVESRPFFYPVHRMPHYSDCRAGDMSVTMHLFDNGLCLPS